MVKTWEGRRVTSVSFPVLGRVVIVRGSQSRLTQLSLHVGGRTPSSRWPLPCVRVKKAATVASRCAEVEKNLGLGTGVHHLAQPLSWVAGLAGAAPSAQKGRK